jgi:hypothetical protein
MLQTTASEPYRKLALSNNRDLEQIFRQAKQPVADQLAGYEFRGYNTPFFAKVLGIQKFIKGFFSESPGKIEGYNIPVRQNGLANPWLHLPNAEAPKRFGFYHVYPVRGEERDNLYPNALLLNYGASARNPFYRVERVLRDYIVQPDPANPDILVGKAYLAFGPLRIPSNFFILERLRPAPAL